MTSAHGTSPAALGIAIALVGACGGAATQGPTAASPPSNDEGPAPDGQATLRLTQAELDRRLASGDLRPWRGEPRGARQEIDVMTAGAGPAAVDGGILYRECVPGGGGWAFFVDPGGLVYGQATYYRYAPVDGAGRPMPTPAIRCFTAEVALADGEAFAGTLELVAP